MRENTATAVRVKQCKDIRIPTRQAVGKNVVDTGQMANVHRNVLSHQDKDKLLQDAS